jgi:peroxiredoxin
LGQLQQIEDELIELGFQIIAVSPDSPESLSAAAEKGKLGYRLVTDPGMDAARAFGLAFRVSREAAASLTRAGVRLASIPGEPQPLLPVPAVFIIRTDGTVAFSYANPDYKVRLHPALFLAAARLESP